jgi:hypothetical protein
MTDQTGPTPGPSTPPEPGPPVHPTPTPPVASVPPPPPPGYGQAGPPAAGGTAPTTKGGAGRRIARVVGIIVVVSLVGIGWKAYQNHNATASAPEKGQCVQAKDVSTNHPSVQKVDCSDSAADYVVLAKISGGSDKACDSVAGTEAVFQSTRGSTNLYALCLKHR